MWRLAVAWVLGGLAVSASAAQDRVQPANYVAPPETSKGRELAKWPPPQQHFYLCAQRGAEWLKRTNRPDGRFVYGFLPALCQPMEGDDYLAQVGAAHALARASRYFGDDHGTALARQALLTLLLETTLDPANPKCRTTAVSPKLLSRLTANGLLVLAIHELANPGKDLLDQGDQLCLYLQQQARADGSLQVADAAEDPDSEAHQFAAGVALHALAKSQSARPAPWKIDILRNARTYYQAQWARHKHLPMALSYLPAYAEAYRVTQDAAFAEGAFALGDWLVGVQYAEAAAQKQWQGGFQQWRDGKALLLAPDIRSAQCAGALVEASRAAKLRGDATRYRNLTSASEAALMFVTSLQYSPQRTRHYVEEFRPAVLGAFHASGQDGNIRIDYTQHALLALTAYLETAAP